MNFYFPYLHARVAGTASKALIVFLQELEADHLSYDQMLDQCIDYALNEEPHVEMLTEVMPAFFWDNKSAVARDFLQRFINKRPIEDIPASAIVPILLLSERTASNAVLTDRFCEHAHHGLARLPQADLGIGLQTHLKFGTDVRSKSRQINVMSLGTNCIPWDLLNHWYIRAEQNLEILQGPFDLAAHSEQALLHLANCTDYFDPTSYEKLTTSTGVHFAFHKPTKTAFNHHLSGEWFEDDFQKLIEFQRNRVNALFESFEREDVAYLYSVNSAIDEGGLNSIFNELKHSKNGFERLIDKPVLMIQTDPNSPCRTYKISSKWLGARIPRPSNDYVWYSPASYTSRAGMAFERAVIDLVFEHLGCGS